MKDLAFHILGVRAERGAEFCYLCRSLKYDGGYVARLLKEDKYTLVRRCRRGVVVDPLCLGEPFGALAIRCYKIGFLYMYSYGRKFLSTSFGTHDPTKLKISLPKLKVEIIAYISPGKEHEYPDKYRAYREHGYELCHQHDDKKRGGEQNVRHNEKYALYLICALAFFRVAEFSEIR